MDVYLEGIGPSILSTEHVAIVGPHDVEGRFECGPKGPFRRQDAQFIELHFKHVLGERRLNRTNTNEMDERQHYQRHEIGSLSFFGVNNNSASSIKTNDI